MRLIADSSSTKTEWAITENNELIYTKMTEGINPYFQTRREISRCVRLNLPEFFFKRKFKEVVYYGAGCNTPEKRSILEASLVAQFKTPIIVESDLLGAARGLFQREEGIACILGTGSNSCLYNGEKIVKNVKPGGYILGDEGSSAVMGKMFIADLLKDIAPEQLSEEFYEKFRISINELMDSVYNKPFPNRFLTTISLFLNDHITEDYVHSLLVKNFRDYFERNLCQYDYKNYRIRFVGPVASIHADTLKEIGREFDAHIDLIEANSMKGLVKFHALEVE